MIPFAISTNASASTISLTVDPALVGHPSQFGFLAYWEADETAVITSQSSRQIAIGPGSDQFWVALQNSPWDGAPHPACAYTDTNILPAEGLNCWASWSVATNGHAAVRAGGTPLWADVKRITLSEPKDFLLTWTMAANVPTRPSLLGAGVLIWYFFMDNSNGTSTATGWPYPPGFTLGPFFVMVAWDGHQFAAAAVNTTPSLHGGHELLTPLPLKISGPNLSVLIPPFALNNSPKFLVNGGLVLDAPADLRISSHGMIVPLRANLNFGILGEAPVPSTTICAASGFDFCAAGWP